MLHAQPRHTIYGETGIKLYIAMYHDAKHCGLHITRRVGDRSEGNVRRRFEALKQKYMRFEEWYERKHGLTKKNTMSVLHCIKKIKKY